MYCDLESSSPVDDCNTACEDALMSRIGLLRLRSHHKDSEFAILSWLPQEQMSHGLNGKVASRT